MSKILVNERRRRLERKGVKFEGEFLDVSKARELGNKSWGHISFFMNHLEIGVIGIATYNKANIIKDDTKRIIKASKNVGVNIDKSGTYHAYKHISRTDNGSDVSEFQQYLTAVAMLTKIPNHNKEPLTLKERDEVIKRKKISAFNNEVVYMGEYESPLKQRNNVN